jgi:alpha-N-acetylglucosaminidase
MQSKGALLRCKDIIQAKNLKIIGVDYNNLYIQAAQEAIMKQNMSQHISVHTLDIYNEEALQMVLQKENISFVNSAYFSGSFSLMPDPKGALAAVKKVLSPRPRSGNIYITQTYQKRTLPLMTTIKPMLKFITTVDFGQLVTVEAIDEMLNDVDGMDLVEHGIMEGSVDTYWQAAYLSVLKLALTKDGKNEMKKERSDL